MTQEQWNAFVAARWNATVEAGRQQAMREERLRSKLPPHKSPSIGQRCEPEALLAMAIAAEPPTPPA